MEVSASSVEKSYR